jgi:hypothetical protein
MPIRPERKHLYPANWKTEIVPMIRARSGDCCEVCGVGNGATIYRASARCAPGTKEWYIYTNIQTHIHRIDGTVFSFASAEQFGVEIDERPIRIILTVAHLNHDETDNRPQNLAHLCQLHHNRHDAKHRAANAKARREREANKAPGSPPIISR